MDTSKFYFPRYLNEPFRLIIFTLDEAVLFLGIFGMGFITNFLITGIILGGASVLGYIKIKKRAKGYKWLAAVVYWYLPVFSTLRGCPLSTEREYLG